MTDGQIDALICKALLSATAEEWWPTLETTPQLEPSLKHQNEMQKMLSDPTGWYRRRTRPIWKKALRSVASIAVVCTLLLGTVMAVSPTARAAVLRWVTEWYEDHVVYRYSGADLEGAMPQYEITSIPEDYAETQRIEFPHQNAVIYENEESLWITFDYVYMQQGTARMIVTEGSDVQDVTVNGFEGQIFLPLDPSCDTTVAWIDPDANLQFSLSAFMDEQALLDMAESIVLVD